MQVSVLATPCWTVPLIGKRLCTGLPDPSSTLISRPSLFGISLNSERAFAWFSLAVLVLSVLMVRVWRDRGVARRLVAVRDNESAAAAMGITVVRTKLLAFAVSGFMAGYAGVCIAFASQRLSDTGATGVFTSAGTFDPALSWLILSMVVIGGLGSIPGAVLGAVYLVGLPAIFGTTSSIQLLTSGIGLIAFILYLPGGLAEVMHRIGDALATGVDQMLARRHPPPSDGAGGASRDRGRHRARPDAGTAHRRGGLMAGGPATLEVEHLTVRFGGLRAVNDVSLSVPPGAVVGLIGPNGSGKTTTLDAISGFVAPEEGSVRVDGDEIGDLLAEERRSLGVIRSFQDCRLYPDLSVEDVLMVCEDAGRPVSVLGATLQLPLARRSERRKREAVERVIGAFGLGRFRHHRAAEISTGTRQGGRPGIGRARRATTAAPRRTHGGHRPARGGGLCAVAAATSRRGRLYDPARGARRTPRVRIVLARGGDGSRGSGVGGDPRRDQP